MLNPPVISYREIPIFKCFYLKRNESSGINTLVQTPFIIIKVFLHYTLG